MKDAPPLFADLLGLPVPREGVLVLAPTQRKAATLDVLTAVIATLSESAPVMLLLEDAHWADPTTLELWTRKIDRYAQARVLLVVTARPEFISPWAGRVNVTELALEPLAKDVCARLAAQVAAPDVLPENVVAEIVAKSDGVPLYVEELTKATRDAMMSTGLVPATLHDSLMASLDRVGAAKSLAQVAAVIGQQFTRSLLAAVTQLATSRLDAELERLAQAALIVKLNRVPEPAFAFRHALLRDIAYENLLRPQRQQLHERIARTIAEGFPAIGEQEPEVMAHHYANAGRFDLASTWLERAGDRAAARSSFVEAHAHYEAGLVNAARLEDPQSRIRRELELLLKMGPALVTLRGPQHPSVGENYQRAHGHALQVGDKETTFKAAWGLWFHANIGRKLEEAKRHSDELVQVASALGKDDLLLEGLHCRWSTAHFRGEHDVALATSADGMRRYDREKHAWMGPIFGGHDPGVCACSVNATTLALHGRAGEARAAMEQGYAIATALKHPNTMCHALLNATLVEELLGDEAGLGRTAERLLEIAERYNLPPQRGHARFMLAWLRTRRGELDALAMVEEVSKPMAMGPMYRYYAALLAEVCQRAGHHDQALQVVARALEDVSGDVGFCVPELHRVKGLCLAAGKDAGARDALQAAIDLARRQGATMFEKRARESLAAVA